MSVYILIYSFTFLFIHLLAIERATDWLIWLSAIELVSFCFSFVFIEYSIDHCHQTATTTANNDKKQSIHNDNNTVTVYTRHKAKFGFFTEMQTIDKQIKVQMADSTKHNAEVAIFAGSNDICW